MTKEKEEKKEVAKKKVAPKAKNTTKEEPKVEKVEQAEKPKEATRAKRASIDASELIPCRSTTHGNLIYVSKRSGEQFFWDDFGTTLDVPFGELKTLNAASPAFIKDVMFVIDDEEAVDALGLRKLYDNLFDVEDIGALFEQDYEDLEESLDKLPKGLRDSVGSKALEMMKTEELDSRSKIKLIEEKLQIELLLLED